MGRDKYDTVVRRLGRHGFDEHSLSRWDGTSTIQWSEYCEGMDPTITHFLDGTGQARSVGETGV